MAGRGQPFAVDSHPQKGLIVDGLLAGRTPRLIADSIVPPLSFSAIQRYKVNVIKPMLAKVQAEQPVSITVPRHRTDKYPAIPLTESPQAIQATQKAIQDAPAASIFRQRLEKLHLRIDRTLDKGENAVRVTTDKDGNEVIIGQDLSPLAPLFNAASKNLEMLGRATGELEPNAGAQVSIQIVCPSAPGGDQTPRITFSSVDQIEAAADPDEDDAGILEIGTLQRPD